MTRGHKEVNVSYLAVPSISYMYNLITNGFTNGIPRIIILVLMVVIIVLPVVELPLYVGSSGEHGYN